MNNIAEHNSNNSKIKDRLWSLAVVAIIAILIGIFISFKINTNRANDIMARYDGYLETVDSLANGCSPLPTNFKGFSDEILGLNDYDNTSLDSETCEKLADIDSAYFMDLKDSIRQMAFDKYYEETRSSFIFKITDSIQCFVKGCPAGKIKLHYHL